MNVSFISVGCVFIEINLKKCLTQSQFACSFAESCRDVNADCKQHGKFRQAFLFEEILNLIFENWLVNELSKEMF